MICPKGLKSNPNKDLKSIDYITIHCTGNTKPTATAHSHAKLQYGGNSGNETSWHYTVDKTEIWQSYNDNQMCYHAGDGYSGTGNNNSIAIEICVNDRAGFKQACKNTAELVAYLMDKHNIPIDNVVQHNKWSGKNCPEQIRAGNWGVTWNGFIGMVKSKLRPSLKVGDRVKVKTGHYIKSINADGSVVIETAKGKCRYVVSGVSRLVSDG